MRFPTEHGPARRSALVGGCLFTLLAITGCGISSDGGDLRLTRRPYPALEALQHRLEIDAGVRSVERVSATHVRRVDELVYLGTDVGDVVVTADHPFARVGSGWTRAAELNVGDDLATATPDRTAVVLSVEIHRVVPTPVYNLTVERGHTYYVGEAGLLVHNVCTASFEERFRSKGPVSKDEMLRWLRETNTVREELKAELERQIRSKGDTPIMRERIAQAEADGRRPKIKPYPSRNQLGASYLSQDFAHKHVANGMNEADATARERFKQGNVPRSTSIFKDGKKLQHEARDSQDFYAKAYEAIARATHGDLGVVDNIQFRSQTSIRTVTIERDGRKTFNDAPIYYSVSRDDQGNFVINHFAGVATSTDGAFNPPAASHGSELRSVVVDGREVWYSVKT